MENDEDRFEVVKKRLHDFIAHCPLSCENETYDLILALIQSYGLNLRLWLPIEEVAEIFQDKYNLQLELAFDGNQFAYVKVGNEVPQSIFFNCNITSTVRKAFDAGLNISHDNLFLKTSPKTPALS